jgi:REP element-mobilizing transposase RayT
MSERYKIYDQDRQYFITFAVEGWVDVFTRPLYKNIIVESIKYCQENKGLLVYGWCLMTNHLHMIIGRNGKDKMEDIVRDFKKYTSVQLIRAIESNPAESRKEWMLAVFASAAVDSNKHKRHKFWQSEYHPVELFYNAMIDQKLYYIHNNPVQEGIVETAEEYLYFGFSVCIGDEKECGLWNSVQLSVCYDLRLR